MSTMKAVVLPSKGLSNMAVQSDFPAPAAPKGKEVQVKVKAAALNPVDWKMAEIGFFIQSFPIVLGCDVAGEVVAVGPEVTRFKVGDKVYGYPPLGTPGAGAFAEIANAREETLGKVPEGVDFGSASAISVGIQTAMIGLFAPDQLHLAPPSSSTANKARKLLVWGASSSVGTFAVQLAKAAGVETIVGVCSKAHFDYVKSLGATHVIDRSASADEIKKQVPDLTDVYDCISADTAALGLQLLSKGGKLSGPAGTPKDGKEGVEISNTMLGDLFVNPEKMKWFEPFWAKEVEPLVAGGKVVPSPKKEVVGGGLEGVIPGLEKQRKGVSGVKLVVEL